MPMQNDDELNRKWKSTCRTLLGEEVGELEDFKTWLVDSRPQPIKAISSCSGKPVYFSDANYSKKARWMSFSEVNSAKLSINEIKDLDSILQAVSENVIYSGDIILGDCSGISESTTVFNSHFIQNSQWLSESKYVAYSTMCVLGDCIFGSHWVSGSHQIRANSFLSTRCFEVVKVDYSSDCYYSHGLSACHDCLFSFNLKNKRYTIGNLQLPPDKYAKIKEKLLSEIRGELVKNKKLPHIYDLFNETPPNHSRMHDVFRSIPASTVKKPDLAQLEEAFRRTTQIIFGVPLWGISKYSPWLSKNIPGFEEGKSSASKKPLLVSDYGDFLLMPRERMLNDNEAEWIGEKLAIDENEVNKLSLKNAPHLLNEIAYFNPEWQVGQLSNNVECPVSIDSSDSYRTIIGVFSKKCALGRWPREAEFIFGFHRMRNSSFCIRCFHSENLSRCFEVSEGRNCTDCLYCHNVENVHDSMFCFNTKNKRNAIGNVELPRKKYLDIKKMVLAELNRELNETDSISLTIFNLPERLNEE